MEWKSERRPGQDRRLPEPARAPDSKLLPGVPPIAAWPAAIGNALQTLSDARCDVWRDFDPADRMRFYSLRLLEAGMIEATPDEIIAKRTDWRFLNELKRELKG
jgi:hypothetical protein